MIDVYLIYSICQGTLPWWLNIVALMKANWYYVNYLHVSSDKMPVLAHIALIDLGLGLVLAVLRLWLGLVGLAIVGLAIAL